MRDLLTIQVELPELEEGEQDILSEAVNNPGSFDSQLYLFETVGTLVSLFYRTPDQCGNLLHNIIKPLLDELSVNLQAVKGPSDVLPILRIHHIIMALGNIAKGFPDFPSPLPEGYIPPPLGVFSQAAEAILVCLEAMNIFRVVRDAVSFDLSVPVLCISPVAFRLVLLSRGSLLRQDQISPILFLP